MNFSSVTELYKRVEPALELKSNELKEKNIDIKPEEIFDELKVEKWMNAKNLSLFDIVNDILKYKSK